MENSGKRELFSLTIKETRNSANLVWIAISNKISQRGKQIDQIIYYELKEKRKKMQVKENKIILEM